MSELSANEQARITYELEREYNLAQALSLLNQIARLVETEPESAAARHLAEHGHRLRYGCCAE